MAKPILVLGATGSFGGAVVLELLGRKRPVRALVRDRARAEARFGHVPALELVEGDALDPVAMDRAARGASAIVHGVNYPYSQWSPNMHVATENVVGAAEQEGATVLFPGNVYNLGPGGAEPFDETAEDNPTTAKGAIRSDLEGELRAAAMAGTARVIVLRGGDFYGPTVRNRVVDWIFANAVRGKAIQALGRLDAPHQWSYVPDLARAAVDLLASRKKMLPYEVVHFPGHVVERQVDFLRAVAEAAERPRLPVRTVPWWFVWLAGRFDAEAREVLELRYLWDRGVILDAPRLRELLPDFRPTPLPDALRATLASYVEPLKVPGRVSS